MPSQGGRVAPRTVASNGRAAGELFMGTTMPLVMGALCAESAYGCGVAYTDGAQQQQQIPQMQIIREVSQHLVVGVRQVLYIAVDLIQSCWRLLQASPRCIFQHTIQQTRGWSASACGDSLSGHLSGDR